MSCFDFLLGGNGAARGAAMCANTELKWGKCKHSLVFQPHMVVAGHLGHPIRAEVVRGSSGAPGGVPLMQTPGCGGSRSVTVMGTHQQCLTHGSQRMFIVQSIPSSRRNEHVGGTRHIQELDAEKEEAGIEAGNLALKLFVCEASSSLFALIFRLSLTVMPEDFCASFGACTAGPLPSDGRVCRAHRFVPRHPDLCTGSERR